MMKRSLIAIAILLLAIQACGLADVTPTEVPPSVEPTVVSETEAPMDEDPASRLERLGGYPCPDSDFTCVDVSVPLNHFDSSDTRTIDVVFAVLPATGERKGMFVTSIGGPGGSGLLSADSYTSYFDPSIPENFDIVFFDQRGINLSGGLYCVQAVTDYYRTDTDATTPEGEDALLDAAQTFVSECVAEMGDTDLLPYLDTAQAVEDLEVFRALMGDDKFWLYGESYGTQFAQFYAASHPDRLAGLILDGVVDLTLTDTEYLKGQAAAFNDVLVATLEACNGDDDCAADMGRDAVEVYDELAAQLKQAPIAFDFPISTGGVERREFTFADLEATSGFLYSETARMIFLRALAAYSRDNTLVPMARVVYNSLYLHPDTLDVILDPSWSDAIYYGVTCRDYAQPGTTFEEQAEYFLREGDEVDASLPRLSSVFYGDLPCVFWSPQKDDSQPAPFAEPFTGGEYPTLVLSATTDPATPYSGAQSVFKNLNNGYLVTQDGGPHVIFGWGNECVDGLVTEFLVNDTLPKQNHIVCQGYVVEDYYPVALANAAEYETLLDTLFAVDTEIYFLPEYYYAGSTTARAIACPYGGSFAFDFVDTGESYTFNECAFSGGFVMTGSGSYDYDSGLLTIEVDVTGIKDGSLTYTRDIDYAVRVTGEYGGETVDLSE